MLPKFPIQPVTAEYRGTARQSGEFINDAGDKVSFAERVRFEFEDSDGQLQNLDLGLPQLDDINDFDVKKLNKGDMVVIEGEVGESRRGTAYFRPIKLTPQTAVQKVRAAA